MKTKFIGKNCIKIEKLNSTNAYLLDLLKDNNFSEGVVLVGVEQMDGRGQRGTTWESEPGKNLTFSILLKPHFLKIHDQFFLSQAVSLGVVKFIIQCLNLEEPNPLNLDTNERVKIKWPNDVYVDNKKIAGILIENSLLSDSINYSIVGIGLNVNQIHFSATLANPTSLKKIVGRDFDLENCLRQLCFCIEETYIQLQSNSNTFICGFDSISAEYTSNLYLLNEFANYRYQEKVIIAKIIRVSNYGKLILEKQSGELIECDLKEIKFLE